MNHKHSYSCLNRYYISVRTMLYKIIFISLPSNIKSVRSAGFTNPTFGSIEYYTELIKRT